MGDKRVKKVWGKGANLMDAPEGYNDYDNIWVRIEFEDGSMYTSHLSRDYKAGSDCRIEVIGTKASMETSNTLYHDAKFLGEDGVTSCNFLPTADRPNVGYAG
jgi:predicted dehydrogenase